MNVSSAKFQELDQVRVAALHTADREFCGSDGARAPRVGDVGIVVDVHFLTLKQEFGYTVEAMRPRSGGLTLWLAEFTESELNLEKKVG